MPLNNPKAQAIDALLPQTQCGQCGYAGCRPYAEDMANAAAPINRCPPGGESTLLALADLLQQDPLPFLTEIRARPTFSQLAHIREAECIGCGKCSQVCPVDAIIGAAKQMHTVLVTECTGCELCVAPCPVDCIDLHLIPKTLYQPAKARQRHVAKLARREHLHMERRQHYRQAKRSVAVIDKTTLQTKQQAIVEAVARVKAKKSSVFKG